MTSLTAAETLICSVCDELIEIGEPLIYLDDQPIHVDCEPE